MAHINQEFDRLKQKYQPALKLMQQLQMQVQVQKMGMKGTKLFIHGVAPSAEVKKRIWDQIKQIDPTFSDLVCNISVSQQPRQPVAQQAPAAMTAGASASGGQDQRRYTVKPGDTLYKISSQFYGDSNQYTKIFNANRNTLRDLNTISPGQELVIPE
jgi:LysM repeat protein